MATATASRKVLSSKTANPALNVRLFNVLKKHQKLLNGEWDYAHIKPFTQQEVNDFLAGVPGAEIKNKYSSVTRSHQVVQAIHAFGAAVEPVHHDSETRAFAKANPETVAVHKDLWKVVSPVQCSCCHKTFNRKLMFPQRTCGSARCQLIDMRNNL